MKQEFQDKMVKYLGPDEYVKRASRMDKVRRKEELNFKREVNPILKRFTNVNRMIEDKLKLYALRCLFN